MTNFRENYTVDIYRLTVTGEKEEYNATPAVTNVEAGIFPVDTSIMAMFPGESAFQMYDIFVYRDVPIKNGDKFVSGTDEWIIKGVPQKYADLLLTYQKCMGLKVV